MSKAGPETAGQMHHLIADFMRTAVANQEGKAACQRAANAMVQFISEQDHPSYLTTSQASSVLGHLHDKREEHSELLACLDSAFKILVRNR